MINIIICDDEVSEIKYLRSVLAEWAQYNKYPTRIKDYTNAEEFLFTFDEDKNVDILLLDIQMGKMDGVSLAKRIRKENREVQIIFITGFMDYISEGYEVEALHYLIKPVTNIKLKAILDRAVEKLSINKKALFISHSGENVRIPFNDIRYAEVRHNYITVYADAEYTTKKTLNELEKELTLEDGFFRAGRSYIISLRYIKKTTKTEVHISNGTIIPLPRGLYESLNRAIIERT